MNRISKIEENRLKYFVPREILHTKIIISKQSCVVKIFHPSS